MYESTIIKETEQKLTVFGYKSMEDYPSIVQGWRRKGVYIPMFPSGLQNKMWVTYSANVIEPVNISMGKVSMKRGLFPFDKALLG